MQGARLYHDGQLDGRRTRIPVFLGRGPDEPPDGDLRAFYERLLRAVADADLRDGDWRLCELRRLARQRLPPRSWSPGAGRTADARHLVVVNLADAPAPGPRAPAVGATSRDATGSSPTGSTGERFERDGDELAADGLYVALDAWASHFLAFAQLTRSRPHDVVATDDGEPWRWQARTQPRVCLRMSSYLIHVRPGVMGIWVVQPEELDTTLSEHTNETEAERAAIACAVGLDDAGSSSTTATRGCASSHPGPCG